MEILCVFAKIFDKRNQIKAIKAYGTFSDVMRFCIARGLFVAYTRLRICSRDESVKILSAILGHARLEHKRISMDNMSAFYMGAGSVDESGSEAQTVQNAV